MEGCGDCIPTPTPVCGPDPDLGGRRTAGHVPFVFRILLATDPFPAKQLLCPEDPVGGGTLGVPRWPGMHIIADIAAERDQTPGMQRGVEEGVSEFLPQPQAQPPPPELLTLSQSRC